MDSRDHDQGVWGLQTGQGTPVDLIVEEHFHRAAPGGMGGTKAAGNYSPVRTLLAAGSERLEDLLLPHIQDACLH